MLQKLIAKQKLLNMTDTQFAQALNITRPYWSMVRRGKRPVGHKVLRGVMQCPQLSDLRPYVDIYLQEGNHEEEG